MSKDIKSVIIGKRNIGGGQIPDTLPIEVENYIADLEAQLALHQWVSVEERLPDKEGYYLIYMGKYNPPSWGKRHWDGEKWETCATLLLRHRDIEAMTHWKPISLPATDKGVELSKSNNPTVGLNLTLYPVKRGKING